MKRIKVLSIEKRFVWWALPAEALRLIRAGMARTFGTARRAIGIILKVAVEIAGSFLYGTNASPAAAANALHPVYREHVGGRFYCWAFSTQIERHQQVVAERLGLIARAGTEVHA